MFQWEACRKLLKAMQREYRDSDVPCLIQAAMLCREKNASKAVEYLKVGFCAMHCFVSFF